MKDYFIENISIKENQNIQKLNIPLSNKVRKHLILTGKNGSGKTTTLKEINILLNKLINNGFANMKNVKQNIVNYENAIVQQEQQLENFNIQIEVQTNEKNLIEINDVNKQKIVQIDSNIESYSINIINTKNQINEYKRQLLQFKEQIEDFSKVDLIFSNQSEIYEDIVSGKFLLAYFEAKRENDPIVPTAIHNVPIDQKNNTDTKSIHKQFIAYMVRLRNTLLNETFDGDKDKAKLIENWFINFENTLKKLFKKDNLKLKYFNDDLNFKIEYDDKSFALNQLSDGYSSLLAILTELILRMEAHNISAYDMQGVVLIDEIETHLHVDLQKDVLPFLVDFFPKIQFIITTHSPFVLSSLSNAVICDLQNSLITEDLTIYSYDALIESYFDSDKYSKVLKDKLKIFEELSKIGTLNEEEQDKYSEFKKYFKSLPTFMADELAVKINEILLDDLNKKN
ncbi:MAG: ATP-binding protein [Sulfurimonas sp.]|nr:ATP-binding protein [Sulfurimonas sp.]